MKVKIITKNAPQGKYQNLIGEIVGYIDNRYPQVKFDDGTVITFDESQLEYLGDDSINIKVKKLTNTAVIPQYATKGSACFDLVCDEDILIQPGETKLVSTGLAFEIPEGYKVCIYPRSGISSKTPLRIPNSPCQIDSDYRGEIKIPMWNTTKDFTSCVLHLDDTIEPHPYNQAQYRIIKGDRVAQAEIVPVLQATFETVDKLSATERGSGGFGHSGV